MRFRVTSSHTIYKSQTVWAETRERAIAQYESRYADIVDESPPQYIEVEYIDTEEMGEDDN